MRKLALSVAIFAAVCPTASAASHGCRWHLKVTGGQTPGSPVVLFVWDSCDGPGGPYNLYGPTSEVGAAGRALIETPAQAPRDVRIVAVTRPRRQIFVWAQYWNCDLNLQPAQLEHCRFVYSHPAWVPGAAFCGLRNIGTVDSPYPVTVCWLHHRQIVGPKPLPAGITEG